MRWDPGVPREVEQALEPLLARWHHMVPTWVRDLLVTWDPAMAGSTMEAHTAPAGRWAELRVGPEWLSLDAYRRDVTVVHELLHMQLAPYTDQVEVLMRDLTPEDSAARRVVERAQLWSLEGVVEDIAQSIVRGPQ